MTTRRRIDTYTHEYGPFDVAALPTPTHNPYKPDEQGRCRHCRQPVVKVHGVWWHAARAWVTKDPARWWWTPTQQGDDCIGAAL